jgi:hypothetical protein
MAGTAEESKKEIFNKVIQWLKDAGLPIVEVEPSDTKLYAKVFPRKEEPMFFYIAFGDKSNDSFSIGTDIDLSGEYERSIKALKERAQDQVFMDIRKLVYPLGINLDTNFPRISLHKLIFFDSLRDKQYFFDSVTNLLNAIQLVVIRFDELRV